MEVKQMNDMAIDETVEDADSLTGIEESLVDELSDLQAIQREISEGGPIYGERILSDD